MKRLFTTAEAAALCHLSPSKIIHCFDSGQLKGFVVPGSRHRRIPRSSLLEFMLSSGIPTDALESPACRVLLVSDEPGFTEPLQRLIVHEGHWQVTTTGCGFEAGLLLHSYRPHVVVLDARLEGIDAGHICQCIRTSEPLQQTGLICLVGHEPGTSPEGDWAALASEVLYPPLEPRLVFERIAAHLEQVEAGR
jgi:two-component system, OmpR family, response regulator RpaA